MKDRWLKRGCKDSRGLAPVSEPKSLIELGDSMDLTLA